jgi:hypothetical protein
VKRETAFLIALALIINASGPLMAQDGEISDKDLEALAQEEKSAPSNPDEEVQDLDSLEAQPSQASSTETPPAETTSPETSPAPEPSATEADTVQVTETPSEATAPVEENVTPPSDELEELKADISESDELE